MSSWGPHTIYIQASFIFIPSTDTYIHIYLITLPQNYVRNVLGRNWYTTLDIYTYYREIYIEEERATRLTPLRTRKQAISKETYFLLLSTHFL